ISPMDFTAAGPGIDGCSADVAHRISSSLKEIIMRNVLLLLLCCTLMLSGCSGKTGKLDVPSASAGLPQPEDLAWWSRAAIDAYMRYSAWRASQSGYIAMFARDGVPIYSDAAGWKDIA